MLQQILRDMFIDPELLAELSDEQKQVLFIKMREEQVSKWKQCEDEIDGKMKTKKSHKQGKNVKFRKGTDGNDWVWVMGDHRNDQSIDLIMEEEAHTQAISEAEKEAEEKQSVQEEEFKRKMKEERRKLEKLKKENEAAVRKKEEEAALYQSLKEARTAAQKLEDEKKKLEEKENSRIENMRKNHDAEKRRSFQAMDREKQRRSGEIYVRWKEMRKELAKMAEEGSKEVEDNWIKQEKKAKEAENELRQIARRARADHRESLLKSGVIISAASAFARGSVKPPVPSKKHIMDQKGKASPKRKPRSARPPNRAAVIEWFIEEERDRGTGIDPTNKNVAEWFHGPISRIDAEKLLLEKRTGSYLVRVSERVWGYTISYRAEDRCKHFLIDTSDGTYQFFGENQMCHNSLWDLIDHHKTSPITVTSEERLQYPCGQVKKPHDFDELFLDCKLEKTAL